MRILKIMLIGLMFASFAHADEAKPKRKIEVCFVLDSTGSMGGLIDGAKQKIWAIANDMVAMKPSPSLRFALISYRDRGDDYVTKRFDLTEDMDEVFKNLQTFTAGGGGDGPESVNQALDESVEKITWTEGKDVLKIIFLVGDAPPHMDYANEIQYPAICEKAVKKNLIINTIQCGNMGGTQEIWQTIARSAEGSYVQLGQTGDMVAISTPMDKELAELNKQMGATLVSFGDGKLEYRAAATMNAAKQSASESAPASVAADRMRFNLAAGKAVQGNNELLSALASKEVKLEDLKDEQLPEEMRKMTLDEKKAYVEKKSAERKELQAKIEKLNVEREAYVQAERKRLAGAKDSFDEQVSKIVTEQAKRK